MDVIVCLDTDNGMMFNHRRQSQDRMIVKDILKISSGSKLWVAPYSLPLFKEPADQLLAAADYIERSEPGEYCFIEDDQVRPHQNRIERLIVYRWNRKYPGDRFLDIDLKDWCLDSSIDFPGYSHEKITKEIYHQEQTDEK